MGTIEKRYYIAVIFVLFALLAVIFRLFYLQIIRGSFYLERSEINFIQEVPIAHNRGLIFDQAGVPLVDNRPSHDVYVTFAMLPDVGKNMRKLMPLLRWTPERRRHYEQLVRAAVAEQHSAQIVVAANLPRSRCEAIDDFAQNEKITGVLINWDKGELSHCDIAIDPKQFPSQEKALQYFFKLIEIDPADAATYTAQARKKATGLGRFKPALLVSDITYDNYVRIASATSIGELEGIAVYDSRRRRYIYKKLASHVLGYVNEISPRELTTKKSDYRLGDRIGRRGVEATYENELRGEDGIERFVVDAKGRRYGHRFEDNFFGDDRVVPPQSGQGLVMALDYDLQKAAEDSFAGTAGSVVVLDPKTGFVLALASFPSYDANLIVSRSNKNILKQLSEDPLKPWLNKATQEHYAPGSTFKAITAIAGLEHGLAKMKSKYHCSGLFSLGKATWRCFKREGHGNIDMVEALKASCDAYFYDLGYDLGPDRLAETAKLLGFGSRTGIDLDKDIPGLMPDRNYYVKRFGYYAPGFVVNNAIGQGDVTVTPIQLAVAYSAILNGGKIFEPQIVRETVDAYGHVIEHKEPVLRAHLSDVKALALVKEGLSYVMKPGGTAYGLAWRSDLPELSKWVRDSGIDIGGKTGTAQVVKFAKNIKHIYDVKSIAYKFRDHAWFVGFAPLDDPEIVVVAMTEHGGFGGTTSAPVVAQIIKTWFEKVRGHGRYTNLGAVRVNPK